MGDLTVLIDFLFIHQSSYSLRCRDEADVNGDTVVDIADITLMIESLFMTLAPLPPCP
jgi:hypothetical protein